MSREDLANDPNVGRDELRQYFPNDLIGRTGLEAMLEPALRGARGRLERYVGGGENEPDSSAADAKRIVHAIDPVPGRDVRTTIDIELQGDVEEMFKHVELHNPYGQPWTDELPMPGAAVVIDVASGEVRAMASYPGFNLNDLDEVYEQLAAATCERPLMNRATQFQLEPGSTVKPIVGIGAITQGLITTESTIECTGFLVIDNKKYSYGRCWVASSFFEQLGGHVAHHPVPSYAPHPTGFLTFSDALERQLQRIF